MITPTQSHVQCKTCTCPISRPMTRTRVVARHVTSHAAVCLRHTSPLLTQIMYHEDCFLKSETARSPKLLDAVTVRRRVF
jgi:hypothetical protein